jgi:molybdopterin/thiamine biosynthesis adenylyltransferase
MQYLLYKPVVNPQVDVMGDKSLATPLHTSLFRLLDGKKTANDIIGDLLLEGFDVGEVINTLSDLKMQNIICETSDSDIAAFSDDEIALFGKQLSALSTLGYEKTDLFQPYSVSALNHQKNIKEGKILILGDGELALSLIENVIKVGVGTVYYYPLKALNRSDEKSINHKIKECKYDFSEIYIHKTFSDAIDPEYLKSNAADLVIYISDDFSQEKALEINEICHSNGKNFIPYQFSFPEVHIGPLYLHQKSACYQCYVARKKAAIHNYNGQTKRETKNAGFNLVAGIEVLCTEIIRYYSYTLENLTVEKVWSFDTITYKSGFDPAFKIPRCPVCGVSKLKPTKKLWENI